jgi:ATPase family associated with various cellular activities (AAA)
MADEFLIQELPAIRRAQERSLVALESMIRLVDWGLWRSWKEDDEFPTIVSLKGPISALASGVRRRSRASDPPRTLSLATFAVCLDAIDSIAEARGILPFPQAERIRAKAITLRERMIGDLEAVGSNLRRTESRAFGSDDPLTASWLLPILPKEPVPVTGIGSEKGLDIDAKLGRVDLFDNVLEGITRLLSPEEYMIVGGSGDRINTAEEHAWPASLAVRALNLVTQGEPKRALDPRDAEALRVWSEQQVRQQLARSVTGEAGQDAAHLAAALAVAMWLEELPLPLLEAAVEQLCTMQRPDGSLVLTRPYLADSEGSVNTPLAADATLAMIAVADQLDVRYPEHPTVLRIERELLDAAQRQREAYFRSSVRKGGTGPGGEEAMLWSSDRARPSPGKFDTWATARTVTALVMILNLESRLITRRLLDESRFSYRQGGEIEKGFDDLVDPQLEDGQPADVPARGRSNGRASRPATPDGTIVSSLRDGLTEPDPDPERKKTRAVLLCGPPGTSKTSLIEAVAKQLADDLVKKQLGRYLVYLVQLSPADFLLDGPSRVEQRAKRIFDYLTQMENVVVLFDEIERLILDRGGPEYEKQEDVFQFMTPSMLPKLTALRQRGSVIRFAIATNYAERIDPAIARKGRIDESFVIAPPNLNARRLVLEDMPPLAAERLAAVTPLWVYGDLKTLSPDDDPEQIMLQSPSGSLASYKSRQSTPRKEILANEILQLAPLYLDGRGPEVLNARGKDEIGAIVWAKDNASLDRREAAAAIIKRLEEQGVLGPWLPWGEEEFQPPVPQQVGAGTSA